MSLFLEKPNLSVVMPTFNEAGNIETVISKAIPILNNFAEDYEIIIVDDGSRDGTGVLLDKLAKENSKIRVIHHKQNQGYGAAVRSGMKETRLNCVFLTDSDGQFDLNELTEVYPKLAQGDFVIGYRLNRAEGFQRKLNTWLWNKLCNVLFKTGVRDVDCAFKLFKRKILDVVELKAGGAMVSAELVVKSRKAGFKILEMGVHHYPRVTGKPSGAHLRVIFRAFKEILQLYPELRK